MKHIMERYGEHCNYIKCTPDEFFVMKESFREIGVVIRMILENDGIVICQIFNPYKETCCSDDFQRLAKEHMESYERY